MNLAIKNPSLPCSPGSICFIPVPSAKLLSSSNSGCFSINHLTLSSFSASSTVHEHSVWLHVCMHGIKYLSLKNDKLIYRLRCHLVADVLLSAEHSKP